MRLVFLLLLCVSLLISKTNTDMAIKKTHIKLSSFSKNYVDINEKMAQTAKKILKQKRSLIKQNIYLKELKQELLSKESSYQENLIKLAKMKKSQTTLKSQQNILEEKLVFVIAKSVSLSIVLDEAYAKNENSLIEFEVLKAMLEKSKKEALVLGDRFSKNSINIKNLQKYRNSLEIEIARIENNKKILLKTQKANKKAIKKLTLAKSSYKKELKNLLKRQNSLKKTLESLNLVKIDEIKKAKREKERTTAFEKEKILLTENLPKVKKHGSSYQAVKTKKYRGKKTIAPLDFYSITKKYGTYTDPIYGIKIFNESISLKPKNRDAKVKTVFNGKVIYAEKTAVLNNIVIVEHENGLNTIYANLSQISPNIKKGKKIKKGYTIGRVSDELIFEVTQKSYHINPIRLFQ